MPPVVIPPELTATLLPRRAEDAPKPKRVRPTTAWSRVQEDINRYARHQRSGVEAAFVDLQASAAEELRPRMQALAELVPQEAPPPASSWTLATASALMAYSPRAMELFDATSGLAFAFEAKIDSFRYEAKWQPGVGVTLRYNENPHHTGAADLLLRTSALQATPEVRAACRSIAERLWPTATIQQQTTLAFTFFENEPWAHDIARRWLAEPPSTNRYLPLTSFYATVRDLDLMREVVAKRTHSRSYIELVVTFGEAAFDLIADAFEKPRDSWDLKHAATSLAVFDDPRAAELLASLIGSSKVRPHVAELCSRFPKTARVALEPIAAKGKGRPAKLANDLLAMIARTESFGDDRSAGAGEAGNVDATSCSDTPEEEATADELPWILVKPPWLNRKKLLPRNRPTLELTMARREERIELTPSLVNAALEAANPDPDVPTFKPDPESKHSIRLMNTSGERAEDDALLEYWTRGGGFFHSDGERHPDIVTYIVHRFGVRAIPGLVTFLSGREVLQHSGDKRLVLAIDSPRIALGLAQKIDQDSHGYWEDKWGPYARCWMRKYPETAVIGLVPAALSPSSSATDARLAELALRYIRDSSSGVDVDVMAGITARAYGAEAASALEALLGWDPRFDLPLRIGKLPPSYRPESMTRPLLLVDGKKKKKKLPLSAIVHLGTMLSFTKKRFAYAGIADVKAACDPRSLAEHAWDLAKAWEMAGSKDSHQWMMESLIHFADDEVVRRTTPAMRSHSVGEVLQTIGTDAAVMELVTIASRADSGNKGYSWATSNVVDRRIAVIAAERGMTAQDLEEAVLPVRDVDYKGFQLDFGGRVLRVGFDERFEVFIVGEDGARLRALPPGRKTDDKKKVEEAKRVWQDLKEEVSAVVARRLRRLERAMITGYTWKPSELVERYVEHPLLKHIGRSLLWEQNGKRFRIGEDGTYADVEDHVMTLDLDPNPEATIRLAHPARIQNEEEVARWVQIFFDYRIVQPFPQISRATRALPEDQRKLREIIRTPTNLLSEDFSRRIATRGGFRQRLSRGEALISTTYSNTRITAIKLRFLPSWVDFDPVEMAECLADIDVGIG